MPMTYLKPTLIYVTLLATLQQGFIIERGSIISIHTTTNIICLQANNIPNATKQIPSQNLYINYPLFLLEMLQQKFTVNYRLRAFFSYIVYEQNILVLLFYYSYM